MEQLVTSQEAQGASERAHWKDKVDELLMEILKNHVELVDVKLTLSAQVRLLVVAKVRFQGRGSFKPGCLPH